AFADMALRKPLIAPPRSLPSDLTRLVPKTTKTIASTTTNCVTLIPPSPISPSSCLPVDSGTTQWRHRQRSRGCRNAQGSPRSGKLCVPFGLGRQERRQDDPELVEHIHWHRQADLRDDLRRRRHHHRNCESADEHI